MSVKFGGVQAFVAEQALDDHDVRALFVQMRGIAMPEGVRGGLLSYSGSAHCTNV